VPSFRPSKTAAKSSSTLSAIYVSNRAGCNCQTLYPDFRTISPLADTFLEARDTRCIDLRLSEAEILVQMKPKGRYNIHVAQRHGVTIIEDTSEQGPSRTFKAFTKETAVRQGIAAKPSDYFQTLVSLFSPSRHGSIFFAEYRGVRIATALVVYFGPRATYFFGGSRDVHRQVMAPYLLHFEIMRKAKALGHEWYDLWGIAPPNEPDHPWQNFTSFKAKFGGAEVHLVPTLDYVLRSCGLRPICRFVRPDSKRKQIPAARPSWSRRYQVRQLQAKSPRVFSLPAAALVELRREFR